MDRVLLCAPNDGHTATYIKRALERLDFHCVPWDYRRETALHGQADMNEALAALAPLYDLILILKGESIDPVTLRTMSKRTRTAIWHFDPRDGREPWILDRARSVGWFFTIGHGLLPYYATESVNAHWLLEAADPQAHKPAPNTEHDIPASFIGTVADVPGREQWLTRIRDHAPNGFRLWGSYPGSLGTLSCYHGRAHDDDAFCQVVSRSLVNLGRDRNPEIERSYGARLFRTLAAGGFLLTNTTHGIHNDFGGCVGIYGSDEDCLDAIDHYVDRPDLCARVARQGRDLVLANHTFDNRMHDLLTTVGL